MEPNESNGFLAEQAAILLDSLRHWTGSELFPAALTAEERARSLFEAPFAVVSHGTQPDPIFNYANRTAMTLFEMTWEEFTALPSRLSAEPVHRDERARLMAAVKQNGYIADYGGVRISKNGRRFRIEDALVWNLLDAAGRLCGQAAMFDHWHFFA